MPTYEYRCKKCRHRFELFHSIKDESVKRCPRCGARAERVPSAGAGILFKGSGFYITDYRSSAYKEKAKQEKTGAAGESGGSKGGEAGSSKGGESGVSKGGESGGSKGGESGGGASSDRAKPRNESSRSSRGSKPRRRGSAGS